MRECDESPPPLLREGIAQFNRREYFEQHETLELLWRAEQREVRRLYQGILQIGVAFHHLRRRNYHGTVYMLTRGARYLTPFSPRCQGVDVEVLLTDAAAALREVERLGPDRLGDFDWQLAPIVRLCSSMLTPAFAPIAGGWFTMGTQLGHEDERPPHRVFVDRFELGVCPVTRAEYECFMDATRHEAPREWSHPPFAHADLPVVGVSWIDAVAYCAWRSEQDGRPARLPTEAEWEFAARGSQQALFPWGDVMPEWIPNGGRGPLQAPWPVTLGEPTDFGLFGIATNVHEWCADWHDKDYYSRSPERNPAGPDQGVRRAARGGAWRHAHTICRVTLRSKLDPSFRYNDFGFRLARSL